MDRTAVCIETENSNTRTTLTIQHTPIHSGDKEERKPYGSNETDNGQEDRNEAGSEERGQQVPEYGLRL